MYVVQGVLVILYHTMSRNFGDLVGLMGCPHVGEIRLINLGGLGGGVGRGEGGIY